MPDLYCCLCEKCHGISAQFVQEAQVSRDGKLYGRYSNRDIALYLHRHCGLDDGQASLMLGVLTRIEAEVHRP